MRLTCLKVHIPAFLLLSLILLVSAFFAPLAAAQTTCEPQFEAAITAIESHAAGTGDRLKLRTKVENAWRMFRFEQPTKNALQQLDVSLRMLASPATRSLPPANRSAMNSAIRAFRSCLAGATPPDTATLIVRTYQLDETEPELFGAPVAGAYVSVNGQPVGITGADGSLTVEVPAGVLTVKAVVPSFSEGEASIDLPRGASDEVRILMDDSKEVVELTPLTLLEAPEGILPKDFSSFTLQFGSDAPVKIVKLDLVELLDANGNVSRVLDGDFSLAADGKISATNVADLRSLIAGETQEVAIRVQGMDGLGFTHGNTIRFRIGQFQLIGYLVPPPSNPSLSVAGIPVKIDFLGTGIILWRTSDAQGRFEVTAAPLGNVAFDSQTSQGEIYYYGQGTVFLTSSRTVSIVMRSFTDVINGVPPITSGAPAGFSTMTLDAFSEPAVVASTAEGETYVARQLADQAARALPPPLREDSAESVSLGLMSLNALTTTASVYAAAGAQNVPVSQTATLTLPKGTQQLVLTYNVFTYEYPYYVLQQSVYNDVWSLAVYAGSAGQQLFQTSRNINSQVSVPPIWQSNGSTGDIREVFDVSALTASADVTVTLFASAMNVGDSALTTIVSAMIGAEATLSIDAITPDTVTPTVGNSSYYSIPRPGASNTFARWFTLKVTKPDTATISRVTATVRGPGDLQAVVDEGPGDNVQVVDNETLRVRVTFHTASSSIASTPPPTSSLIYRFRVQADDGGQTLEDQKDSGARNALWRMPDGIARYGARDAGGDDWTSRGTYNWLNTHSTLLTRVDDISGEHARNIGHNTHERGVDIDMFHFYTFPGGVSGGANYTKLAENVIGALNGDGNAHGRVLAWVNATRTGMNNLLARPEVSRLYYTIGSVTQQQVGGVTIALGAGWAESLIETGTVTATTGQSLDLGVGNWTHANSTRITYNAVHNSHIHIALNSGALQN